MRIKIGTETDWLTCESPFPLIRYLRGRADVIRRKSGRRKSRLFSCACCRRIWHLLTDERSRAVVEVAERLADDRATAAEIKQTSEKAWEVGNYASGEGQAISLLLNNRWGNFIASCYSAAWPDIEEKRGTTCAEEERQQAHLLRCIFGNPFQPVSLDRAWLAWNNNALVGIAQAIYAERAFDRLPLLADALEEAGCDHAAILDHCRDQGNHARGCWVVDLLLGKS